MICNVGEVHSKRHRNREYSYLFSLAGAHACPSKREKWSHFWQLLPLRQSKHAFEVSQVGLAESVIMFVQLPPV
eukprot:jgi/Botrbrau1/3380/Bobra.0337s0021.1